MTILGLGVAEFVSRAVLLVAVLLAVIVAQRLVVRALTSALDASRVPSASIFIYIVRGLLWFVALLCVLQPVFGVSPTGFVAALGVGSLVISLGMQATVANIVAGLGLMLGHVVQPGDQVSVGGYAGKVVDVTWRHTIVRGRDGSEQVIPNSVLNTTALTRSTDWNATDCSVRLPVRRGVSLEGVSDDVIRRGVMALGRDLDASIAPSVSFEGFAESSIAATAHFHLLEGVSPASARDRIVKALTHCDWLA
ncbi:mechanosensitive ion channel family protein [Olsenella sp. HMSC062G07]|uniref:mechanosensitive ion channel family protein n=1 Tax=Olsenella sp. HMSC062G07 TaxID=1739330 RepID=UPI0008A0FC98|nr:mechanosensitive ion channel domain-containing protein [Olsenella sp. HMSC062G07]OFK23516.1 hypothetical protein HMPREF2826_04375 [Olsenella sp. HMSC062G07]